VRNLAIATLLARHWPAKGKRHNCRLALSGYLFRSDVDPIEIVEIVRAVTTITNGNVTDAVETARDTIGKLQQGNQQVTGGPALAEYLDEGNKVIALLNKWLGRQKSNPAELPEGCLYAGDDQDLKIGTEQAWQKLRDHNEPPYVFRRGGVPIRLTRNDKGQLVFQDLNEDRLRNELAKAAAWVKFGSKNKPVPAAPPSKIVANMLADIEIPLQVVTRIVYAPIVAAEGTIQTAPGYHEATRTYYPAPGLDIPDVPVAPTQADITKARELLLEPLVDFPFVSEAERAHAIALCLLPFMRELIDGLTPLHLIEKQAVGTGAGLLAKVALFPALGNEVSAQPATGDDDEWRKRITSILLSGPTVALLDNAEALVSPSLAALLTTRVWTDRVLGVSRTIELVNDCVWVATANNLSMSTDIMRRSVRIRLDAKVDRPWQRPRDKFIHPDLLGWVTAHRPQLVWAALTIIRAWIVAGRPVGRESLGTFEEWARVMGGVLDVAGVSGFLTNSDDFYEASDIEGDATRAFLEEWRTRYGDRTVKASDLVVFALDDASPLMLAGLFGGNDRAIRTQFGKWLARKLRDQVRTLSDGTTVQARTAGTRGHAQRWQLVELTRLNFDTNP
jgi:hypothetical protein